MNILVPLNDFTQYIAYKNAGAKEFYLGFYSREWNNKFGKYSDINRMSGYGASANKNTFNQALEMIERITGDGNFAYMTFNSAVYSSEELEMISDYFKKIGHSSISGVIVSTPELVELAVENNIPVVMSTIAGIYNSDIAAYYKELNVKRIILPRDLSIEEIREIVDCDRNLEYEVFIMRNGCKYSDSFCLGFHRSERCSICADTDNSCRTILYSTKTFYNRTNMELTDDLYRNHFHKNTCGICGIYDFVKMGINAGKVVGRSDECGYILEDIKLLSENIKIAENSSTREEYLERMKFPNESSICNDSMSCYYPEVRFS